MFLKGNNIKTLLAPINEYKSTQISTRMFMSITDNSQPLKSDIDNLSAKVILDTFLEYLKE